MDTEILVDPSVSKQLLTYHLLQQAPKWSPSHSRLRPGHPAGNLTSLGEMTTVC